LVLEEYFFGFSADRPHDLRSVSKVFASLMAGIAMDHGAQFTMQSSVTSLFGLVADGPKGRITVGQLLSHSSGLACDDNDDASPGNEDAMQSQRTQPDWYAFVLDLPMAHDPGSHYAYCSGGINLVAGIVHRGTSDWLPDFFDRQIARPLQFGQYALNLTPTGDAYGGGGAYLCPRDLLKIGQLYLDGGVWHGHRIVSRRWTVQSTAHQIITNQGGSDGFGWHRYTLRANGRDYQEFEANGNGGQFLIVVPELDLTVVTTAGNYNQYGTWKAIREELVPQYIIPSIRPDRSAVEMKPPH
jgi:CubicO group peptidase (beta-lactamase class C family)